jgi:hypothetical protein
VMLRFNWMMYYCHWVSAQLRQYEIIIIIIILIKHFSY